MRALACQVHIEAQEVRQVPAPCAHARTSPTLESGAKVTSRSTSRALRRRVGKHRSKQSQVWRFSSAGKTHPEEHRPQATAARLSPYTSRIALSGRQEGGLVYPSELRGDRPIKLRPNAAEPRTSRPRDYVMRPPSAAPSLRAPSLDGPACLAAKLTHVPLAGGRQSENNSAREALQLSSPS